MMKKIYTIATLVFLFTLTPLADFSQNCLILNEPLDNRVAASDLIFEGKVTNATSYWNETHDKIFTSNTIEVYKIFKGSVNSETVELITEGGIVDDTWIKVDPTLTLSIGEVGVFICNNNSTASSYKPTNSSLGFIKYNLEESSASDIFTNYGSITSNMYQVITRQTGASIREVKKFDVESYKIDNTNKKIAAPVITSFSPSTATAGTKTLLTINGSGFGASRGTNSVGFKDANNGGASDTDVNDNGTTADDFYYEKWSDTQIKVYVPHRNGSTNYFAGTGKISVKVGGTRAYSSTDLVINWSRYEAQSIDGLVPSVLANINGAGGYTWRMNSTFAANTAAVAAVGRALNTWSCAAGINWSIGSNTSLTTNADDGINVIRFANSGELANNILASTATIYRLFCGSGTTRRWYLLGFDMAVNNVKILGTFDWQYGPALASNSEYDLETVMVHELGHAMQVGHIIKKYFIMNYSISNGENTRSLHADMVDCANDIGVSSFATASCTGPSPDGGAMIKNIPSSCTIGIDEKNRKLAIEFYPNPAANIINVNNKSGQNIQSIIVYDQLGKVIYSNSTKDLSTNTNLTIDTNNFSDGIYFVKVSVADEFFNQKVVIAH